jgi:hypothetical protein
LLDRRFLPPDASLRPPFAGGSGLGWGRPLLVGLGVIFGLAVIIVGLIGMAEGGGGRTGSTAINRPAPPSAAAQAPVGLGSSPGAGLAWHAPSTVVPPGTPIQEQYDQALSQGLGALSGMDAATALPVPAPAITAGWPRLAVSVTPESWASAFVTALLNVNYAHQSRAGLAAWLQAQEAPELVPGVPPAVADKALYISLLDPGLFGGQPTPIASPEQWAADARTEVTQSVRGLMVQPDPGWAQATAAGWQPGDVRMTEEDVSGVLDLRRGGPVSSQRFTLQILVGSARWHDGYGTVAVTGWQVQ